MKKMVAMMMAASVVAGSAVAAPELEKVFKKADADGNGKVCAKEFAAYKISTLEKTLAKKEATAEEKASKLAKLEKGQAKMFAKKDVDGNGTLCLGEFKKAPEKKAKKAKDVKEEAKPASTKEAAKPACAKTAAKSSCGSCTKSGSSN